MVHNYFTKFPKIDYKGKSCVDITRRVKVVEGNKNSPFVFYPFEITNHIRSDLVAHHYYDDPYLDWMIYHSNDIVDPYYDWYLDPYTFNKLLEEKYGSLENSQRKVKFYQNNWSNDTKEISPSFYNNTLPNIHKKYYTPVFGINTKIISYKRKEEDAVTNTNRIMQYTIANTSSFAFVKDEAVNFRPNGSEENVGNGQVEMANSTILRVRSVAGDVDANTSATKTIVGIESAATATANSSEIYFENFSNSEAVFWSAVNYYEYEQYKNERKKNIKLVGDQVAELIINEFSERLDDNTE